MPATDYLCTNVQDCINQLKTQLGQKAGKVCLAFELDGDKQVQGDFDFVKVEFSFASKANKWLGKMYCTVDDITYQNPFGQTDEETIDGKTYIVASVLLAEGGGQPAYVETIANLFIMLKMDGKKTELQEGCDAFLSSLHENMF